jgi:hypothetical protein
MAACNLACEGYGLARAAGVHGDFERGGQGSMRGIVSVLVFSLLMAISSEAQAAGNFGPSSEETPSVFTYAYRGLLVGSLAGLSAGYLVARDDGFDGSDWKPMVYGLGFGALGGAAIGLTLGFVDVADKRPGMANIALRDMVYGVGFGALLGAITGGLVAIGTKEAENVLFGASIGALSGVGAGLIIGIIEGKRSVNNESHRKSALRVQPLMMAVRDARNAPLWLAGASGRF